MTDVEQLISQRCQDYYAFVERFINRIKVLSVTAAGTMVQSANQVMIFDVMLVSNRQHYD